MVFQLVLVGLIVSVIGLVYWRSVRARSAHEEKEQMKGDLRMLTGALLCQLPGRVTERTDKSAMPAWLANLRGL
ncbi:MAG: hypothetical protein ACE5OZ_11410 [Candidatus Heimdallarchaeota archaeon]